MENNPNSEHIDNHTDNYFDECGNNDSLSNALEFVRRQLWAIKVHNYNCKRIIRFLRKNLKFNKSPKKKGYGQFFTDEEKRYLHGFECERFFNKFILCFCFLHFFFIFSSSFEFCSTDGWMNIPLGIPNCPPGLEYLITIDQLLVKQKVELLEAFTGFETNNKFTIKNSLGQKASINGNVNERFINGQIKIDFFFVFLFN